MGTSCFTQRMTAAFFSAAAKQENVVNGKIMIHMILSHFPHSLGIVIPLDRESIGSPKKVTLVTTRSSGDSFLNQVELQNGCLSRGHSNLFIQSTLSGEPYDEDGQFSKIKHCANMEAAIKKYIERVDDTPCMRTTIKLHRGATDHPLLNRRSQLLVFLKGSAKEKAEMKQQDPSEYRTSV